MPYEIVVPIERPVWLDVSCNMVYCTIMYMYAQAVHSILVVTRTVQRFRAWETCFYSTDWYPSCLALQRECSASFFFVVLPKVGLTCYGLPKSRKWWKLRSILIPTVSI